MRKVAKELIMFWMWSRADMIWESKSGASFNYPTFNLTIDFTDCILNVTDAHENSTGCKLSILTYDGMRRISWRITRIVQPIVEHLARNLVPLFQVDENRA